MTQRSNLERDLGCLIYNLEDLINHKGRACETLYYFTFQDLPGLITYLSECLLDTENTNHPC